MKKKTLVKGVKQEGEDHRKKEVAFFGSKEYYPTTNVGGGPHVTLKKK